MYLGIGGNSKMKIMVINGSPKGSDSNTMRLTRAFLDGIGESEVREYGVFRFIISVYPED